MAGLVKQSLHKTTGKSLLTWTELEDVLLDVELALNNRPLSYVEEGVQLPLLTPNTLLFGSPTLLLPEEDSSDVEVPDLKKRAKYLQKCKDLLFQLWTSEYLRGLQERHNLKHNTKQSVIKVGDVVIIKSDQRNRNKWKLGIIDELFVGRDGVVRVARIRAGKSYLERPIQHLYSLELSCDRTPPVAVLNIEAPVFRPRRDAAFAAGLRIQESEEDTQDY